MNLPPLNYTMMSDFWNCPAKCYHARIVKDLPKEEKSQAQLDGIAVHEGIERYIKTSGRDTPPAARPYVPLLVSILPYRPKSEIKFGMTMNREPCGFFGDPFFRVVLDCVMVDNDEEPRTAMIMDWKTGKVREDKRELECQAIGLQAHFPSLEKITGCYIWLKENRFGESYDLTNTTRPFNAMLATRNEMMDCVNRDNWPCKPNPLCGWCPVMKCPHNKVEERMAREGV